jgi:hypothetical protein
LVFFIFFDAKVRKPNTSIFNGFLVAMTSINLQTLTELNSLGAHVQPLEQQQYRSGNK